MNRFVVCDIPFAQKEMFVADTIEDAKGFVSKFFPCGVKWLDFGDRVMGFSLDTDCVAGIVIPVRSV